MTLYYFPLEPYKERYTEQWSAPETGWLERRWKEHGIEYVRVEGEGREQRPIRAGVVLDATRRCKYAMSQISNLLSLLDDRRITNDDVLYFDDFWHPGIESLPYCFHLLGVKPKTFAFLHAQSVDEFDFTYEMRHWMRHFERGIGHSLTGIFTSCPTLKRLIILGGIAPGTKVYATGHPFCSAEVEERMPQQRPEKEDRVVWSSRWDREKRPQVFMEVAKRVWEKRPDITFVVCTGAESLRSNEGQLVQDAYDLQRRHPERFIIRENLTKEEYYAELCRAKVQFNCALQDFVAITLLEASVAGCYPVYPRFRSFPETFENRDEYMYDADKNLIVQSAAEKLLHVFARDDLWTPEAIASRAWIHTRFDTSWKRQWDIMQGKEWTSPFVVDQG